MQAHPYSKDQLVRAVTHVTGRRPTAVRSQAMLVVSTFADGSTKVLRAEALADYVDLPIPAEAVALAA